MKKILSALVMSAALCGTPSAHAADHDITVCHIQIMDNSTVLLAPCGGWDPYYGTKSTWIIWTSSSIGGELMFKQANLAMVTHANVKVRVNSAASGYDKTTMIRMQR